MPGAWMRSGVWLIAAVCVLCAAVAARAQTSPDSTTVPPPTPLTPSGPNPVVAAQDSTYAPRYRFSPVFTNKIDGNVTSVGMSNDFHTGLLTPWGSIFDFVVSQDEKNYRLQNRVERTKIMRLTDLHTFNTFWNGSASYSDSRVFNRSIALGGGVQDLIFNDQQVNLGSTYRRKLLGFRSDMMSSAGAIKSERTFKNDRGLQVGGNGGVAYDIGHRFTLQGRGALRGTRDESQSVDSLFTGLGSHEDSLQTGARFEVTDSTRIDAKYTLYNGDRDFTDQARGSLNAQELNAQSVIREHEKRNSRNTTVHMTSTLFQRFNIDMSASHDEQVYDYDVQNTRDSRTVGDGLTGSISYVLPWKTTSKVTFENTSTLRDYGPQSISSLNDKFQKAGLLVAHQFTPTFSMNFTANTQLSQSFYIHYAENPRDQDQVDTSFNLNITSKPFTKLSALVGIAYSVSDFVNIDSTQSSNNRSRELWDLRPSFTYTVNPRFRILQRYGLTFEYTDYDFLPNQNFLDRNITFGNEFQFEPTRAIHLKFGYDLYLHDTGSYLPDPVTGERLLDVSSKDRRDHTLIRVDYTFTKRISFFAENQYSNRQDLTPDNELVGSSTDGSVLVGTTGNYDWGGGRTLRFTVSRVKRFSPSGSEGEKNYWDAKSELAYPF